MKVVIVLMSFVIVTMSGKSAHAACPPAPVASPSDTVIQMRAHGGNAGMGPTSALDATEAGAVVFKDADKSLYVCDGTTWQKIGADGGDTLAGLGCTEGQIPVKSSTGWDCAAMPCHPAAVAASITHPTCSIFLTPRS